MILYDRFTDLDGIFQYYGVENQLRKLSEELCELNIECHELETGKEFISELADVLVMTLQFYHSSLEFRSKVDAEMDFKVNRQLERIANETSNSTKTNT